MSISKYFATISISIILSFTGCSKEPASRLDAYAESYVKLVLALGTHAAGYVDAYYGPPEWQTAAQNEPLGLDQIIATAKSLQEQLSTIPTPDIEIEKLRKDYLTTQLGALTAFAEQKNGQQFSFDEESWALYNAVAPTYDIEHYSAIIAELDELIPGTGSLTQRYTHYRNSFIVTRDKLEEVFQTAITEARRRTLEYIDLPENEDFRIEYVSDKSWSAYNWYQGDGKSLIQVNTDLPITIDRIIDLASHEGYPGHHVYNALLEKNLVNGRGWVEFSVYPLFSPQSLIAEGSANFGVDVAFPGSSRIAFERDVLFPLAGLDPATAEKYYEVFELTNKLSYAGNNAARGYLDGTMTEDEAIAYMIKYNLRSEKSARQRIRFVNDYRSYVINYNYGQDLVRDYIDSQGGTANHPQRRWELFRELLSSPRLPAGLKIN